MKKIVLILALFLLAFGSTAQALTANEILQKVDENMVMDQAISVAEMTIHGRSGSRTIRSRTWIKGRDKAFVEYLSPAREKGKKMHKLFKDKEMLFVGWVSRKHEFNTKNKERI